MKITIDGERCEAHGDCVLAAPTVFDIGEDDEVVRVLTTEFTAAQRDQVVQAARLCPVAAITVED